MEVSLQCEVCGKSAMIEDVDLASAQIMIGQWLAHDHEPEVVAAWQAIETEVRKFQHTTAFGGVAE